MPATSVDYLRAVGQQLREARQQRGEDLYDIAEILRLKPSYLYALEEGDYTAFPGRAYAFGFLRSYADYLGFQGEEVLRQIKAVIDAAPVEPKLEYRAPIIERHRPTAVALVTVALIIGATAGGWYAVRQTGGLPLDRLAALPGEIGRMVTEFAARDPAAGEPVPIPVANGSGQETGHAAPNLPASGTTDATLASLERLAAPEETPPVLPRAVVVPVVSTPPAPAASPPEPEQAASATGTEAVDITSAIAAELPADQELVSTSAAARPRTPARQRSSAAALLAELRDPGAAAGEGRTFGDPSASGVMLLARDTTWIQVRSADRAFVRTRILEPGDRFYLPARDDLALWTGNAGGLEIWLQGERLGTAGEPGQVVRDLPLRPDALKTKVVAGG